MLWCDLDMTFDLAVMALTYKILSGVLNSICCRRLTLGKNIG